MTNFVYCELIQFAIFNHYHHSSIESGKRKFIQSSFLSYSYHPILFYNKENIFRLIESNKKTYIPYKTKQQQTT